MQLDRVMESLAGMLGHLSLVTAKMPWVSAGALVIANLLPLVGVLFLGWDVLLIVVVFWLENVVIGGFNILRILIMHRWDPASIIGKLTMIPFFSVHYGMFTFVHGIFVFAIFGGFADEAPMAEEVMNAPYRILFVAWALDPAVRYALLCLVISHGISFLMNYIGGGEFRRVEMGDLMSRPYGRIVVLHLAIIGGGFLVLATGQSQWALALLVLLKIGFDLRGHVKERTKLGETK
jgi:uncharacterized protein DUF6498